MLPAAPKNNPLRNPLPHLQERLGTSEMPGASSNPLESRITVKTTMAMAKRKNGIQACQAWFQSDRRSSKGSMRGGAGGLGIRPISNRAEQANHTGSWMPTVGAGLRSSSCGPGRSP